MQSGTFLSVSPSFNSYSSDTFAEIAKRVVEECRAADETGFLSCQEDPFSFINGKDQLIREFGENSRSETKDDGAKADEHDDDDDDDSDSEGDDFEFSFVAADADSSNLSADEIFYNGQIRPVFPVFGKELLPGGAKLPPGAPPGRRLPLRKLFTEERQSSLSSSPSSSSSSEADELEGVPPGTYCVWTPKRTGSQPADAATAQQRKKSNSTGWATTMTSSKRWKFREFLRRSNSDGKDIFVFLMPRKREETLRVVSSPAVGNGHSQAGGNGHGR